MIAQVLGFFPEAVTAIADEDSAGHCMTPDPWNVFAIWDRAGKYRDIESIFRCRILSFMAGREAEEEVLGKCRGGDGDDQRQIAFMFDASDLDIDLDAARMRAQCRGLVRRYRGSIERVAKALMKTAILDADQIAALVHKERR